MHINETSRAAAERQVKMGKSIMRRGQRRLFALRNSQLKQEIRLTQAFGRNIQRFGVNQ